MKNIGFFYCWVCISLISSSLGHSQALWDLAMENKETLKISTLFMAQNVQKYFGAEEGIDEAIRWCMDAGISRVFIEGFRNGITVNSELLIHSKEKFKSAGIEASGCITTVNIGKQSSTGVGFACYTSKETKQELQKTIEFLAEIFDVIMVDDFLFTDCECEECRNACGNRPISEYRNELMTNVSRDYMLMPAKKINPDVKLIIKYPRWYDDHHRRGYDVLEETEIYDMVWVGTETRDSDFSNYSRGWEIPQYESYFIMRWLKDIGKSKTSGGWIDALGTTPTNYLEQARQTVLADAGELMLFSYEGLITETNNYGNRQGTGIADMEALKKELPGLFKLAKLIHNKPIKGIMTPKPAHSDPWINFNDSQEFLSNTGDSYIYDFIGMMGFPLVPVEKIDTNAKAAFFSVHALKDPGFDEKFSQMLSQNKPVMISENLADQFEKLERGNNLIVLKDDGDLRNLLKYDTDRLNEIRNQMLAPFGYSILFTE
jgi:hypothetical protein